MKHILVPMLALTGVVTYGGWLYHGLEEQVRTAQKRQQALVVDATSFKDAVNQRRVTFHNPPPADVSLAGSVTLPTTIEDRLKTYNSTDIDSVSQRLTKLRSDAGFINSSLKDYQRGLRETHEHLADYFSEIPMWEALGSSIPREHRAIFDRMIQQLYQRTQERIRAAQTRDKHIINATHNVFFQALASRDAEMIYILHTGEPSEASRSTFQQEVNQFARLCATIDMKPTTSHKYFLSRLKSGSNETDAIGYHLFDEPPFSQNNARACIWITFDRLPNGQVKLTNVEYFPMKR